VIGAAAASRPLALLPILFLPPARSTGLSASMAMPGPRGLGVAILIGFGILGVGAHILDLETGLATAFVAVSGVIMAVIRIAEKKIGGHTGDVLGACQQLVEITLLLGLSASANWNGPL
jgi:adenosylcobinamide-GDP ribazoletransferase